MTSLKIPENQSTLPWVQSLVSLIQNQAKTIQVQAEQIAQLTITVQELRDEITRLKNTPKRPKFRPPARESSAKNNGNQNGRNRESSNATGGTPIQKAKEEIVVKPSHVPSGSRFKGYASYSVQELTLTPKDVVYQLEIWQAPDGSIIRATLPPELEGTHFGAERTYGFDCMHSSALPSGCRSAMTF